MDEEPRDVVPMLGKLTQGGKKTKRSVGVRRLGWRWWSLERSAQSVSTRVRVSTGSAMHDANKQTNKQTNTCTRGRQVSNNRVRSSKGFENGRIRAPVTARACHSRCRDSQLVLIQLFARGAIAVAERIIPDERGTERTKEGKKEKERKKEKKGGKKRIGGTRTFFFFLLFFFSRLSR